MTEKEIKAQITQAHTDGYNRGFAKAEEKIADIKANCDLAIEGRDIKIKELEQKLEQTEKDLADYQFNYPTIKELEKTIKLLGERCNQLLKDKGDLTDRLEDLQEQNSHMFNAIALQEQQIEKMKCCANCKSFKGYGETCEGWGEPVLNLNCDCTEWELRR